MEVWIPKPGYTSVPETTHLVQTVLTWQNGAINSFIFCHNLVSLHVPCKYSNMQVNFFFWIIGCRTYSVSKNYIKTFHSCRCTKHRIDKSRSWFSSRSHCLLITQEIACCSKTYFTMNVWEFCSKWALASCHAHLPSLCYVTLGSSLHFYAFPIMWNDELYKHNK